MQAGALRHRVTLQRLEQRRNALGEVIETWATLGIVWAQIRDLSGREWYQAQQLPQGEVSTVVTIRYRADITRMMRVVHGARLLDVVASLDKDGRRKSLQLMCREASR